MAGCGIPVGCIPDDPTIREWENLHKHTETPKLPESLSQRCKHENLFYEATKGKLMKQAT